MLEGEVDKLNKAVFGPATMPYKDSRWGWYLPTSTEKMNDACWSIVRAIPPAAVMYHIGEGVTSQDIETILGINPGCHVIFRWWCPPRTTPLQTQIDKLVETVSAPVWNGLIPVSQRWVQFGNEPNTTGGSEGYGSTVDDMKRFNADWLSMYEQVKAANPNWGIGFTPMTPGNRDVFFPHGEDPEGVPYFFHGPEAACPEPTSVDIALSILSGPCYESLKRADALFAHIYSINDPENEKFAPWCGLRWRLQQEFLPHPALPVFINELGIRGVDYLIDYHNYLIANCPLVLGTCQYKLRDEPWNFNGSNPAVVAARSWYNSLPEVGPGPPPEPPPSEEEQMRAFVGIHYTNDHNGTNAARQAFGTAKIEAVKVFNFTNVAEAALLRQINPNVQFLCRLWSGRFGPGHQRPDPQLFINDVKIGLGVWLEAGCNHFEIHNEPNEPTGKEGFGSSSSDAVDFEDWFLSVLSGLRELFPTALFGFPGLVAHDLGNDLQWLDWCQTAIEASDFLCVHAYWQKDNHLHPDWGLRYHRYLDRYPTMIIEITEWGSSDADVSWEEKAGQYVAWLNTTMEEPLIRGTYSFILQSPDWEHFAWVDNDGNNRPMVAAVGAMSRPPLHGEPDPDPEPPDPDPPFLCGPGPSGGELITIIEVNCLRSNADAQVIFAHFGLPLDAPANEVRQTFCEWANTYPAFIDEHGTLGNYLKKIGCREGEPEPPPPDPPIANFTASPVSGEAPLTVAFTDMSLGAADEWYWDFGDGYIEYGQNLSHTYTVAGNYTVALTVTGPGGSDTLQRIGYIQVLEPPEPPPPPTVAFYAEPGRGVAPLVVQFYNNSGGKYDADTIVWDFGDGGSLMGEAEPLHVYTEPGLYAVTLTLRQGERLFLLTKPGYIVVLEKPEPEPPKVRKFSFAISGTLTVMPGPDGTLTITLDPVP